MVSHLALIIIKLCHALGHEFEPHCWQTLFGTQAQHLCFIHDSFWIIWFDTIICLSNSSCELWNRKIEIKEIYFEKIKRIQRQTNNKDLLAVAQLAERSLPIPEVLNSNWVKTNFLKNIIYFQLQMHCPVVIVLAFKFKCQSS